MADQKINWKNTLFLIITPLIGIGGTLILASLGLIPWQTWALSGIYLAATGIAITAGYHRLMAHPSYVAAKAVKVVLTLLATGSYEGSALEWCTDHRNHHRYADTDRDPYNINKGFWFAHIGWLIRLDTSTRDYSNVPDLTADPFLRFQHRYFGILAAVMGFVVPMAIAGLWGDFLGGLIVAGALRITINHHFTFFINSLCHCVGKQVYTDKQTARDNWITALVTYGEGFHNFHHQFPIDFRNGIRYFHFDPTKWLIYGLSLVGLANNLKRVSDHKILQYRLRLDEKRLLACYDKKPSYVEQTVVPLKQKILSVMQRIEELEKGLVTLKASKMEHFYDKLSVYQTTLKEHGFNLRNAQAELDAFLYKWKTITAQAAQ